MARARDDIDLMQYHDGELEPDEAADLERCLGQSEADRTKLRALEQVGESVATFLQLAADDAEPQLSALWRRVEQGIAAPGAATEASARRAAAPVATAAANGRTRSRAGLWTGLQSWLGAHRGHVVTGAVAAAAAALLVMALRPERVVERIVERTVAVPAPAFAARPAAAEYLDVAGNGEAIVRTLSGSGGEGETTIIWVMREEI